MQWLLGFLIECPGINIDFYTPDGNWCKETIDLGMLVSIARSNAEWLKSLPSFHSINLETNTTWRSGCYSSDGAYVHNPDWHLKITLKSEDVEPMGIYLGQRSDFVRQLLLLLGLHNTSYPYSPAVLYLLKIDVQKEEPDDGLEDYGDADDDEDK